MRKSSSFYSILDEDKNHIRLISILPASSPENQSVINCTIEQVSLSDFALPYRQFVSAHNTTERNTRKLLSSWIKINSRISNHPDGGFDLSSDPSLYRYEWGDYETLSYTWGDQTDTRGIVINGEGFRVTANLEAALRSLRLKHRFEGRYRLWVDAICIDQENLHERARQVAKMREIYAISFAAVGWLGEEKDGSEQALELLDNLASFYDPAHDFKAKDLVEKLKDDPSYLGTGCWLALCSLFERSYWSRPWVIREIAMSSSDMIMHCGGKSLSWERLCLEMGIIHRYLWQVKDSCLAYDRQVAGLNGPWRWPVRHLNKIWKDLYPIS
jgi:hypothetical protein